MSVYKRNGKWYIDFYCGSKRIRRAIGPSKLPKKIAEDALKDAQVKVIKGEYLGVYEDKKITLKDFSGEYFDYKKKHLEPLSFERCTGITEHHLIPYFKEHLSKISIKDVENYMKIRLEKVMPRTINKEVDTLNDILNLAVKRKYINKNSVKDDRKRLKEPPGRVRYLSDEELELLLDGCKGHWLEPLILIALLAGLRRSELLGLSWSKNIDLKNRMIMLDKTKNNKRRVIYVNDTLLEVLRKLPRRIDTDLLFPDLNGSMVSMALKRLCKEIGIKDFHWHDQRHCFASYLAMNDCNPRTIQELLGHSDIRMTVRYSHLSPEHLQSAVNTLDTKFANMRKSTNLEQVKG